MNEEIENIIEATSMGKLEKEAVLKSLLNLHSVAPMLHHISKCINDAIENNEDDDKISEVVELMKGIAEDNWMFVRN